MRRVQEGVMTPDAYRHSAPTKKGGGPSIQFLPVVVVADGSTRTALAHIRARLLRGAASLTLPAASIVVVLGVCVPGDALAQLSCTSVSSTSTTCSNAGTIIGSGYATNLTAAVSYTVNNSGYIKDTNAGILIGSNTLASTVTNIGTIIGGNGSPSGITFYGATPTSSGSLDNSGRIEGGYGVFFKTTGTVTNAGSIIGNSHYGVQISGSASRTSSVTNGGTAGRIQGRDDGVIIGVTFSGSNGIPVDGAFGTVTNSGVIAGTRLSCRRRQCHQRWHQQRERGDYRRRQRRLHQRCYRHGTHSRYGH
jgi:hypothetical protein